MAHINVGSQTTLLSPAHFFVFALYDASAPTVLLESIAPAKPYGNPLQITFSFNCISGHIYIIKLWESVDTTPTGTVRNQYSQTISLNSVDIRLPEYLKVDTTANLISGQTTFEKADYENWEFTLERIGQGTMTPESAADIIQPKYKRTNSDDTTNDLGPKITLLTFEDVFQPDEEFVVVFTPQIIVSAPAGTASDPFSSGRVITSDETLTSVDFGKALKISSATNKISITLPLLSAWPDFRFMYLFSVGGSHINASFLTQGSDKFLYPDDKSVIVLGQCENLIIYKAFGKIQIFNDLTGVKMVGELLYNYSQTEINTILCAGQLLNRLEYPRLWNWVQTLASGVVSDSVWTGTFVVTDGITTYTQKGNFSTGDGSTTFRLPLLTNIILKGVDGSTRLSGSFENHQLLSHQHETTSGTLPSTLFGRGVVSRILGKYSGPGSGVTDLTSVPVTSGGVVIASTGSENRVKNSGSYLLIRY
jgi:hypothetical protein